MRHSQIAALALTAIGTASAVTLQQYSQPNCRGAKQICSNIAPRICCLITPKTFLSGDCVGCANTDAHIVWGKSGNLMCGSLTSSRSGTGCTGGNNLRGHSYCVGCKVPKRSISGEDIEERGIDIANSIECKESVEPDLITFDDKRFFKINHDVPKTDTAALLEWVKGDNPQYSSLASHLLQHETHFEH